MTKNVAELDPSLDASYSDPTRWQDDIWQDRSTEVYGQTKPTSNNTGWEKFVGQNSSSIEVASAGEVLIPFSDQSKEKTGPLEFTNRLFETFQRAQAEGKPLVVEFSQDSCKFCRKLNDEVLSAPEMEQFKDRALFVRVDPMKDEDTEGNVAALINAFSVEKLPTTLVLDVTKEGVSIRGKMVGLFPLNDFINNLNKMLPAVASESVI